MKHFKEIFGKVMIELSLKDVAMLGTSVPVVVLNDTYYTEFTIWANNAFSPNLAVRSCWFSGCRAAVHANIEAFNEKSASTLKANGLMEYSITAEEDFEEDGRPCGCCLVLNIPVIPDV